MKYLALIAALALTACSSDQSDPIEQIDETLSVMEQMADFEGTPAEPTPDELLANQGLREETAREVCARIYNDLVANSRWVELSASIEGSGVYTRWYRVSGYADDIWIKVSNDRCSSNLPKDQYPTNRLFVPINQ